MLTVSNLKKTYGNFTAVDGISFDIQQGEIFGLLGPNGAGKTSTINMMIGLARPTAGDIAISGIESSALQKDKEKGAADEKPDRVLEHPEKRHQNLLFKAAQHQLGPSYGFSRPVIEVREVWARAKQKLATRALPTTRSEDTGTYFLAEQQVLVLAKHWDSVNGIWWVKCAIETNKGTRHLWTGAKRFYPETLPLEKLPEE